MNRSCQQFRSSLARALSGRPVSGPGPGAVGELSWHEHLLSCGECRELLEAEEALETLLASLPEPRLPAELARRVLQRLEASRTAALSPATLDALLDLDQRSAAPADLVSDVLSRLAAYRRRRAELERLGRLLDTVPAPTVPAGLAQRVLAGLDAERGLEPLAPAPAFAGLRAVGIAAALVGALAAGLWAWNGLGSRSTGEREVEPRIADRGPEETAPELVQAPPEPRREEPRPERVAREPEPVRPPQAEDLVVARAESIGDPRPEPGPAPVVETPSAVEPQDLPSDELLASLDLLESWDLLNEDGFGAMVLSLDTIDEVLLELDGELGANEDTDEDADDSKRGQGTPPSTPSPSTPSKG